MAATNHELWQHATVIEARDIANGIRRIVFEVDSPVQAEPGSHVDVEVVLGDRVGTRSYSVVECSEDGRRLAISVLRAPHSRGGSVFMHTLTEGDSVTLTHPLQNFPLRVGAPRYLLLAGGIGVTALMAMARTLNRLGADYRFVYAGRNRGAMAYLRELAGLHDDRLDIHVDDEAALLDIASLVGSADAHTEMYVCGPIGLMSAVRESWAAAGLPPTNLRYETFGNSGRFEAGDFLVRVPRLGVEVHVGADQSMLQALEDAGVDMMFDCRKGECGLCEVKVLQTHGVVDHRDVFYSEQQRQASGRMCCCVSRMSRGPEQSGLPTVAIDVS
ncbi:vanillate O-demethylase oxygenase subunit B [Streptomyces hygroscopicus subsp. jinggangensis 5008]|nr:vanillate O-demethylase oxygenase subunit B [Streptomyces hygroscopicus subsp. jinggangensis 5008]